MTAKTPKPVVIRRAGSIGLLAAAFLVTACSDDSSESAESTPEATAADQEQAAEGDTDEGGAAEEEQTGGGEGTADQSSAEGVVSHWVTAIVQERPTDACLVMATPATDTEPAELPTPEMCESQAVLEHLGALNESFAPEAPADPPVVAVTGSPASDGTAAFSGEEITVDGQPLQEILVANSTGVEQGQVGIEIEAADIDGLWYVTDMGLSFG